MLPEMLCRRLATMFVCIVLAFWPAGAAWAQTLEEMELERKRRDFEQLVDTRLAGNAARARALTERAERAIRIATGRADLRPDCDKSPVPPAFDVLTAELSAALNSTASRLKDEQRAYDEQLREYEHYRTTDSRKIEMYFAVRLQRNNVLNLRSKERSLIAMADSYRKVIPEVTTAVVTAACLTRGLPSVGDDLAELLSSGLLGLINDYRQILYNVQR